MQYTKLFFLLASLLMISSMVFAANVSNMPYAKNDTMLIRYKGHTEMVQYSPQEPVRELISDFKQQAGIPKEIKMKIIENCTFLDENRLIGSYQRSDLFINKGALTAVIVPSSPIK